MLELRREDERVGDVEREIRDRVADSLAEISDLDVRRMFSGFGFYVAGILVAAAWDEAFRLRYREDGRWVYKPVDEALVDDPSRIVPLVRNRAASSAASPTRGVAGDPCQPPSILVLHAVASRWP